ncbi:hypothetical protein BpHYR1_027003 [Brachionus plicatilis]|uniref:Uncharacterized protein n=1 Tax=Brachionus plicatilis TaxID=10195 RepID=A0A3M7SPJ6_BRAPC|nr:hypothetical protein BpHYR1_027003 [Brachionus plicatilis]
MLSKQIPEHPNQLSKTTILVIDFSFSFNQLELYSKIIIISKNYMTCKLFVLTKIKENSFVQCIKQKLRTKKKSKSGKLKDNL